MLRDRRTGVCSDHFGVVKSSDGTSPQIDTLLRGMPSKSRSQVNHRNLA
jgi:hypothetical protein